MPQKTPTISLPRWNELADEYYLSARCLAWFCADPRYAMTFLGHQSLELYFKIISVKESGTYDNNNHDLFELYKHAKSLNATYDQPEIAQAVDLYRNSDQSARYGAEESKKQPANLQMGTALIQALDAAVKRLRNLSVTTDRGIDRLIEGETMFSKSGVDPILALHSVIFFYNNNEFTAKKPEIQKQVNFTVPTWPQVGPDFPGFPDLPKDIQ